MAEKYEVFFNVFLPKGESQGRFPEKDTRQMATNDRIMGCMPDGLRLRVEAISEKY